MNYARLELLVHTAMFVAETQMCFNYLVRKALKGHRLVTQVSDPYQCYSREPPWSRTAQKLTPRIVNLDTTITWAYAELRNEQNVLYTSSDSKQQHRTCPMRM
jgi:hypothetical protein